MLQDLNSVSGTSVDKRLKGFCYFQQVGSKTKEKGSFYSTCEYIFYDKNMDEDESLIIWFYWFLEKHTYTDINHTYQLLTDSRPNSTCFPMFPPLNLGKL